MTEQINKSWREQRKAVVMTSDNGERHFISVWEAASFVSAEIGCKHETAKNEIRKAIRNDCTRYKAKWQWKE